MTKSNDAVFYCYGVANTKKGLMCFVSKNKRHDYNVVIEENAIITSEEAHLRAWELLTKYDSIPTTRALKPGSVANHMDDLCVHRSIVLDVDDQLVLALFMSSNPHWNSRSRLASKEELSIAGYRANRVSYLVPVIRSIKDFVAIGWEFPDYRLEELREEFPWSVGDVEHG